MLSGINNTMNFVPLPSTCFLSDQTKDTAPDTFGKHAKMDYFQKNTCSDEGTNPGNVMTMMMMMVVMMMIR